MTMPGRQSVPSGGVVRQQGPEWLVDLLFHPPAWFRSAFHALLLVALVLVVRGLYQRGWRLDADDQRAMLDNAVMVVSIIAVALVFVFALDQPYVVDVVGGWAGGLVLCRLVLRVARSPRMRTRLENWLTPEERLGMAWLLVGVASFALPELLVGRGTVPIVSRGSVLLLVVAVVLMFYNVADAAAADGVDG